MKFRMNATGSTWTIILKFDVGNGTVNVDQIIESEHLISEYTAKLHCVIRCFAGKLRVTQRHTENTVPLSQENVHGAYR